MLKSIEIENFRRLRALRIDDLGQINLIVGANNAGKTSLLEAIWLLRGLGDPFALVGLATFRNMEPVPELLWPGLFSRHETSDEVVIGAIDSDGTPESLRIKPVAAGNGFIGSAVEPPAPVSLQLVGSTSPHGLRFEYSAPWGGTALRGWSAHEPAPQSYQFVPVDKRPAAFLTARNPLRVEDLASALTEVLDRPEGDVVLAGLQALEPRLERLSLGYANHRPVIRVHIGLDRPLPFQLLGEGATRLLEILLTLARVSGGTLLIDEVENGLYYGSLGAIWRAIARASDTANVQVFATTHSLECVDAAVEAFADDGDRFRLHRLEVTEDGGVRAVTYDAGTARTATEMELEVR